LWWDVNDKLLLNYLWGWLTAWRSLAAWNWILSNKGSCGMLIKLDLSYETGL